jgi:uncharacterized radical SAM superfamily Fe-S cluster-containing enzyme
MPRLKQREETYFTTVRGMCRRCRTVQPARVFFRDGKVWQQSLCPCGPQESALVAGDSEWYLAEVVRAMPDRSPLAGAHPPRRGCPHDCGPCTWHASPCQLPVVSITNACNLRCPICFTYNRADAVYAMTVEEMQATVEWIVKATGSVDLINITGGEPTLHPKLLEILAACRRPEIGRITMNSNGLRLAEDFDLCRRLADLGVCVILSLHTFDPGTSRLLHGCDLTAIKQRAIENLTRAGVRMTLLCVLIREVNERALARILDLVRHNEQVLSLTVQTMTYTGQGGGHFPRSQPIPIDEAARIVCRESGGELEFSDFMSRPSAHPLCYLVSYLLRTGDRLLPFARFAAKEEIRRLLDDSYLLRPASAERFFRDAIDQLYANGETEHLAALRKLVERLYPPGETIGDFQRQRLAEGGVRTIYLHAHMDEDSLDCSRAMLCPDLVPAEPGRLIPACTYNLFYRMQDPRFYVAPPGRGAVP